MVLIVDIVDSNLIYTAARFFSLFRATLADLAELAKQLASGEHTHRALVEPRQWSTHRESLDFLILNF